MRIYGSEWSLIRVWSWKGRFPEYPHIWNYIRHEVDDRKKKGQFILTGSASPEEPKRHFVDPSLAIGALGLSVDKLIKNLNYFGFLFESLVIRDLRIYAEVNDGKVFHYRDSRNMEVDAIVEYPDGAWAAFEVKMGFNAQNQAASNLLVFASKINQEKMGAPAALTVITANGFSCRRKDGVNVIPLAVLTA
jgi:predicted AAA+ superfamily ATPase